MSAESDGGAHLLVSCRRTGESPPLEKWNNFNAKWIYGWKMIYQKMVGKFEIRQLILT